MDDSSNPDDKPIPGKSESLREEDMLPIAANHPIEASAPSYRRAIFRKRPPLSFSEHARERLKERTSFTEEDVFELVADRAFIKLRSNISFARLMGDPRYAGMDFESIRATLPDLSPYIYKYLMIWSEHDCSPYTFVIAVADNKIVTVLSSESREDGTNFDDLVTPEAIAKAKQLAEHFRHPSIRLSRGYANTSWLTENGELKRKKIPAFTFGANELPLAMDVVADLVSQSIALASSDGESFHSLQISLVSKVKEKGEKGRGSSTLLGEYKVEAGQDGEFEVIESPSSALAELREMMK